jgi:hypothetical protein
LLGLEMGCSRLMDVLQKLFGKLGSKSTSTQQLTSPSQATLTLNIKVLNGLLMSA